MITSDLEIFITRYYEFTNIEFPNKIHYKNMSKKFNLEYLKNNLKNNIG